MGVIHRPYGALKNQILKVDSEANEEVLQRQMNN